MRTESMVGECSQTHSAKTSGASKTVGNKMRACSWRPELELQFWNLLQWPWANRSCRMSDLRDDVRPASQSLFWRLNEMPSGKGLAQCLAYSGYSLQCPYFTLCFRSSFLNTILLVSENQQWMWSGMVPREPVICLYPSPYMMANTSQK